MKIRTGFVSNSSSSSFVVAFPKDISVDVNSVREYLFGDREYIFAYDDPVDTLAATEVIVSEMKDQIDILDTDAHFDMIMDALSGYLPDSPHYEDFKFPDAASRKLHEQIDWDAYEAACKSFTESKYQEFKAKCGDMNTFVFSFSDNDGHLYCTLEHGGTFDRVLHIAISHH